MRVLLKYGLLSLLILLMPAAFAQAGDASLAVSPQQAAALHSEKKAVIVDVREDSEWREQHIPGAIHIPLGELESRLAELKAHQNGPIITQCRSGKRSQQAQQVLKSAGFDKVYNLDGGLIAWDKAGLATE